jgi:hypothetical protein
MPQKRKKKSLLFLKEFEIYHVRKTGSWSNKIKQMQEIKHKRYTIQ